MDVKLPLWTKLVVLFVKALTYVYEFISRPYYYLTVNPMKVRRELKSVKARPSIEDDPSSPYRCVEMPNELSTTLFPGCYTLDDMCRRAVKLWPQKDIVGTRELIKEESEVQPNGRTYKKMIYGNYHWESYHMVDQRLNDVGCGLLALNVKQRSNVLIFCETRAEWMIVAQACFRFNFPLVTLYPTLGEEGIVHGIIEAEVSCIITSENLLVKLVKLLPQLPNIKHVIYCNDSIYGGQTRVRTGSQSSIDISEVMNDSTAQIQSLTEIERLGRRPENKVDPLLSEYKPKASDLAVIMYTSGSTGLPKGVEITHGNLIAGLSGEIPRISVNESDVYIGYLPLAHVLELQCEIGCVAKGIKIGYSSPLTLTDTSSKIKRGTLGDASVLQPTLMAAVPVILDRVYKGVWEKVNQGGPLSKALFQWAYQYKLNRLHRGYPSPTLDKLVFQRISNLLGGKLKLMIAGGAPLSEESQNFMNIVFCRIIQGYGLTETCGGGTMMEFGNLRPNNVGAPLRCTAIRLREWPEGRYSPMDKPYPRGEVLIGGRSITRGYYKNPEKTSEEYFTDEHGLRWFCSGDIGQFNEDGTLSIIDRKKDLVKLQTGEYISLGKVELALSNCPLVETVCIYGESSKHFVICLMVPKKKQLMQLAEELETEEKDFAKVCENKAVIAAVLQQLHITASDKRLERIEYPQALFLTPEPWTPDSGLITAAFKLKRREIQEQFQSVIDTLYASRE